MQITVEKVVAHIAHQSADGGSVTISEQAVVYLREKYEVSHDMRDEWSLDHSERVCREGVVQAVHHGMSREHHMVIAKYTAQPEVL